MSRDSLEAAKSLAGQGHWRSSVNRSYYAAYCAVTAELVRRNASFPHGRNNPAHEQLPDFVAGNLPLPQSVRRRLRTALRTLRSAREDADYRPAAAVDRTTALSSIRSAVFIQEGLEVLR